MIEPSRYVLQVLRKDEEFILYRGRSQDDTSADSGYGAPSELGQDAVSPFGCDPASAGLSRILLVAPVLEYPRPESLKLLEHAYSFREVLDRAWAARPIGIARHWNRTVLVMEDPGGVPLDQLLGQPLDIELSLSLAISLSNGIGHLHQRGIVHKDIKPAHILVDCDTRQCWLRGFGVASRLKRERQAPEPPEFIEGTLAYMAPEQTGRMNRFDRFAQRPLFARSHALSDAHGLTAVHRVRSHGVGPLPYRQKAGAAKRAAGDCPGPGLGHHPEAARQDG